VCGQACGFTAVVCSWCTLVLLLHRPCIGPVRSGLPDLSAKETSKDSARVGIFRCCERRWSAGGFHSGGRLPPTAAFSLPVASTAPRPCGSRLKPPRRSAAPAHGQGLASPLLTSHHAAIQEHEGGPVGPRSPLSALKRSRAPLPSSTRSPRHRPHQRKLLQRRPG